MTTRGSLARLGFVELEAAAACLHAMDWSEGELAAIAEAADPDRALGVLTRLAAAGAPGAQAVAGLREDPEGLRRAAAVFGVSDALGEHALRHPDVLEQVAHVAQVRPDRSQHVTELLRAVGADTAARIPVAQLTGEPALNALRLHYRRLLFALAVRDVALGGVLDDIAAELADLADAALETALAIARAEHPAEAAVCRLAVIGMGKCGGRELNYVSDVDVIFVAESVGGADETAALRAATRIATSLMRICTAPTGEGSLWEVDAALRPEGKQGVLVRTLDSHVGYYRRWAKTWEFQALLKARVSAGDVELGEAYVDEVSALVWAAAAHEDFVSDVQHMRRRVEDHIPAREADRQLKLGRGGLRDVEFAVQLLQLVHGRSDVMLRSPTTLDALEALATWGYVGREDAAMLAAAYRFLRTFEHRIQINRLQRTHIVPTDERDLRRIGRSMGMRGEPVVELTDQWRRHALEVRRLHEKLFYRPLLHAVARLDPGEARLTPEAARERLEALGYADPAGALRHLEALTSGVSRRAAIQRTLLPVLLGWFADAPDPDAGLLAFRRVSDALGASPWYLRLLRDESAAAQRMATILASSRFATDLLLMAPESVQLLAADEDLLARTADALDTECRAAAGRAPDLATAIASLRAIRRRELFRIAAAEILGLVDVEQSGRALSDIADAVLRAALDAAIAAHPRGAHIRLAVIAMGRFGGAELGYASDADVLFVHEAVDGTAETDAADIAAAIINELRAALAAPSTEPPLALDADLRPEGRQGPLVRSLASYAAYYERWSSPWEAQALLRSRAVAGDADLGARFTALIDPLRWPAAGLSADALREMRRLKARMESERLPRGADPTLHTKLGRGGLSDVEWTVQLLQMEHGQRVPSLRCTGTLEALTALVDSGLVDGEDAEALGAAWRLATRVRGAVTLAKGAPADLVPTAPRDLAGVAHLLGYAGGAAGVLLEDYRRITRRARAVVERVFYGQTAPG